MATVIVAAWAAGCGGNVVKYAPDQPAAVAEAPAQPAVGADSGSGVMATVNGQALYMRPLNEHLVRSYGLPIAQHLVASELVRQAADKNEITASKDEVIAEIEQTSARLFAQIPAGEQRRRALQQVLDDRGLTQWQWHDIMRRSVLLGKLAAPKVTISPEDAQEAFAVRYGRKVVVRDIEVASLIEAQEILKALADGADFAELATKKSLHPSRQTAGLLPPIGAQSTMDWLPLAVRQTAMAMKTVSEVSNPIQAATSFHILKLEQIIPPQDVKFDDVKDEVISALHEQRTQAMQQQVLGELFRNARIEFVHPTLKAQADERKQRD